MFFRIDDTNYYVITDGKNVLQIFEEIFGRMDRSFISYTEKQKMISSITRQLKEKRTRLGGGD